VLVNDFGAINVDAEAVAASTGDTIALSNGCVCCSIGDDLSRALIQVLDSPKPFDAVVIEASGVSDPWKIAQIGLADPQLMLEAVIVLVDAAAVLAQARDPRLTDTLERQLRGADLVVLNKTDLADTEQQRRVSDWVRSITGSTPQFKSVQARLPQALLFGVPAVERALPAAAGCGHHDHAGHQHEPADHEHGEQFESWTWRSEEVHAVQALRGLLQQLPVGVLRLKGVLKSDEHGHSELQFAGKHGSVRRCEPSPERSTAVVAIGLAGQMDRAVLDAAFASALCR
jgi:G3E family GTPase